MNLIMQKNGYFGHLETTITALFVHSNQNVWELALCRILKARGKMRAGFRKQGEKWEQVFVSSKFLQLSLHLNLTWISQTTRMSDETFYSTHLLNGHIMQLIKSGECPKLCVLCPNVRSWLTSRATLNVLKGK